MRDLSLRDVLGMAGLASVRHLREQGMRPADGCEPVGMLRGTGTPLWRLSDSVVVVPVPAGRAARMEANRTCAVCGVRSDDPLLLGPDRRTRFCADHIVTAWSRLWATDHAVAMDQCRRWAGQVLADPVAVVVAFDVQVGQPGRFVVMDFRGATLADEVVRLERVSGRYGLVVGSGGSPVRLAELLHGRVLVSPVWWQVGRFFSFVPEAARMFSIGGGVPGPGPVVHRVDEWVSRWLGLQPVGGCVDARFKDAVRPYVFSGNMFVQAESVVSWVGSMGAGYVCSGFDTLYDGGSDDV